MVMYLKLRPITLTIMATLTSRLRLAWCFHELHGITLFIRASYCVHLASLLTPVFAAVLFPNHAVPISVIPVFFLNTRIKSYY